MAFFTEPVLERSVDAIQRHHPHCLGSVRLEIGCHAPSGKAHDRGRKLQQHIVAFFQAELIRIVQDECDSVLAQHGLSHSTGMVRFRLAELDLGTIPFDQLQEALPGLLRLALRDYLTWRYFPAASVLMTKPGHDSPNKPARSAHQKHRAGPGDPDAGFRPGLRPDPEHYSFLADKILFSVPGDDGRFRLNAISGRNSQDQHQNVRTLIHEAISSAAGRRRLVRQLHASRMIPSAIQTQGVPLIWRWIAGRHADTVSRSLRQLAQALGRPFPGMQKDASVLMLRLTESALASWSELGRRPFDLPLFIRSTLVFYARLYGVRYRLLVAQVAVDPKAVLLLAETPDAGTDHDDQIRAILIVLNAMHQGNLSSGAAGVAGTLIVAAAMRRLSRSAPFKLRSLLWQLDREQKLAALFGSMPESVRNRLWEAIRPSQQWLMERLPWIGSGKDGSQAPPPDRIHSAQSRPEAVPFSDRLILWLLFGVLQRGEHFSGPAGLLNQNEHAAWLNNLPDTVILDAVTRAVAMPGTVFGGTPSLCAPASGIAHRIVRDAPLQWRVRLVNLLTGFRQERLHRYVAVLQSLIPGGSDSSTVFLEVAILTLLLERCPSTGWQTALAEACTIRFSLNYHHVLAALGPRDETKSNDRPALDKQLNNEQGKPHRATAAATGSQISMLDGLVHWLDSGQMAWWMVHGITPQRTLLRLMSRQPESVLQALARSVIRPRVVVRMVDCLPEAILSRLLIASSPSVSTLAFSWIRAAGMARVPHLHHFHCHSADPCESGRPALAGSPQAVVKVSGH